MISAEDYRDRYILKEGEKTLPKRSARDRALESEYYKELGVTGESGLKRAEAAAKLERTNEKDQAYLRARTNLRRGGIYRGGHTTAISSKRVSPISC